MPCSLVPQRQQLIKTSTPTSSPTSTWTCRRCLSTKSPQLQAQISQISQALQNPNLPQQVRRQTETQHQQLQMQLQQAQAISNALAVASFQQQHQQHAVVAQANAGMGFPAMAGYPQQMAWNSMVRKRSRVTTRRISACQSTTGGGISNVTGRLIFSTRMVKMAAKCRGFGSR